MKKLPKEDAVVDVTKPARVKGRQDEPLVTFQNVTKCFEDGFKCLENVSFTIGRGEFVFLVGRSGAGKSSLVKLLIREQTPSEGSIIFDDVDIAVIPHKEIHTMRRRIGVVFQDFKVLASKNVFDNVAIALEVADAPKSQIKEVVDNVLTLVGLLDKSQRFPTELSGGELQRVAIARALAHEPDLLVADEPTGNIDPVSSAQIMDVFEKINKMGVAILMATHDDRVVDKLKKRVVRLDSGKIISDVKEGKYAQSAK
jgi:cell division transport system ATP-binding protein